MKEQNDFQKTLFTDLTNLVKNSSGEFLTKDYNIEGHPNLIYRVFTYMIPRFSDFKNPNGLNCRGTMFLVNKETGEAQLVALPMKKFFSLGEGEKEDLAIKIEDAKHAYIKEDGSLLTSYISPIDGKVKLKSKNVSEYLNKDAVMKSVSDALFEELQEISESGISVDLELTTPENRVMMEYDDYKVHVLKARSLENGEYIDIRSEEFAEKYPVIAEHLVKEVPVSSVDINRKDIEGYVLEFADGRLLKIKTIPYLSIVSVISIQDLNKEGENLYRAALDEVLDEVRSMFVYKARSPNYNLGQRLANVDKVEAYAKQTYHDMVKKVNELYESNKHLERGDFARAVKDEKQLMPLLMQLYTGGKADYKQTAIKIYAKNALK